MAFLDHVPADIIAKKSDQEMRIELMNGSAIQVVGTDRVEVVGPNPIGCVFSEYSLQNPKAWNFVRPILAENNGWSVFNYTPRGMNHAHELHQMAIENPNWYSETLTVEDTGAISHNAIQDEIDAGMSPELVQQEFYCSFEYGLQGAYYLNQMAKARTDGRICGVPVVDLPVHTAWDLGIGDSMPIWFFQLVGKEIHLVDFYENSGEGLAHYAKVLAEKGYWYGKHLAPHDIKVRELGTGTSRIERAEELGIKFEVVPLTPLDDGIEAVRSILSRCWFDLDKTKDGRNALMNYQKRWNENLNTFDDKPLHDWASHGADAFRMMAVGMNIFDVPLIVPPVRVRPINYNQPQGWMG